MKRTLALILALMMLMTLTACTEEDAELLVEVLEEYEQILQEYETAPTDAQPEPPEQTEGPAESYPEYDYTETVTEPTEPSSEVATQTAVLIDEDGWYYSAEDVALYLVTYGCLPENYITKNEARDLGWTGGSVEYYAPGCAIGGDRFYNYDGQLPGGRETLYYECDIDTDGYKSRGAKRLVFTYGGSIYYTEDHYETFLCLYEEARP